MNIVTTFSSQPQKSLRQTEAENHENSIAPVTRKAKQKSAKRQEAIKLLITNINNVSKTTSPLTLKKLKAQLAQEVKKLSHLIKNVTSGLSDIEKLQAMNQIEQANEYLTHSEETPKEVMPSIPKWLQNDIPVTNKQLALVVGDSFLKAAGLEGGNATDPLDFALYRTCFKSWHFESVKTPGIKDRKRPHIDLILGRLRSLIRGDFHAAGNTKF